MATRRPTRRTAEMPATSNLHGILLIDKEHGWTSHDVVAKARRITGQRKIGHTGTLDPMATGLLVLCLGDATRLVEYMAGHDKRYTGEVVLGERTDTDDAEGEVVERRPVPEIGENELARFAAQFTGEQLQRPPAFSAIKVAGQRAYAAARAGKAVELAERPIVVHSLRLTRLSPDRLAIEVECGAGTYIRSLARDIGGAIGCGGHLSALRRTAAGGFDVADACSLGDLELIARAGLLEELLRQPDEGVPELDAAIVAEQRGHRFGQGNALDAESERDFRAAAIRVYDDTGSFLGIGQISQEGRIRPVKVLASSRSA